MEHPDPPPAARPPDLRRVRISGTDWLVIWSALLGTIALDRLKYPGWWMPAMVVGHFFLFCNVFKVPRKLELLWAGVFLINTGLWLAADRFNWRPVLLSQTPVTLAVIGFTLARRRRAGPGPGPKS
jgi:hypothetical protein